MNVLRGLAQFFSIAGGAVGTLTAAFVGFFEWLTYFQQGLPGYNPALDVFFLVAHTVIFLASLGLVGVAIASMDRRRDLGWVEVYLLGLLALLGWVLSFFWLFAFVLLVPALLATLVYVGIAKQRASRSRLLAEATSPVPISRDGRTWWDGAAWQPFPEGRHRSPSAPSVDGQASTKPDRDQEGRLGGA